MQQHQQRSETARYQYHRREQGRILVATSRVVVSVLGIKQGDASKTVRDANAKEMMDARMVIVPK
jgi:hypothetical protein